MIGDASISTNHPRILKAHEDFLPWSSLALHLKTLRQGIDENRVDLLHSVLQACVHGYDHKTH